MSQIGREWHDVRNRSTNWHILMARTPLEPKDSLPIVAYESYGSDRQRMPDPDPIRCPYCVEGNHFKVMTEQEGGLWSKCGHCGHLVSPGSLLIKCNCPNCLALERPISQRPNRFSTHY